MRLHHHVLPSAIAAIVSLAACTDPALPEPEPEPAPTPVEVARHAPPSPEAEAFADDVADAMIDRIVALLFREFAVTTPENAAIGSAAISNIFHDHNRTMRLVGDVEPLQASNRPRDDFERDALIAAKQGHDFGRTERRHGDWVVRKSLAVSTAFSGTCVHCHSNFEGVANAWVGALMVEARIED